PLGFFTKLAAQYGDVVQLRMGPERAFLIGDPGLIRDILVTNQRHYKKGRALERSKPLLGEGLLTSEDPTHLRQRRLIQPKCHRDAIESYANAMSEYAVRTRDRWEDGATLDISQEMMRLTLGIVGKTLFDADVESQAKEVGAALTDVLESFWTMMLPFADLLERLPVPPLQRAKRARKRLDAMIFGMIRERRTSTLDRGDMLSMLLFAQDEEDGGRRLTDQQVRDEALTLFLAGHETTANALAWTWYLLSGAPDVEQRLHAEIDRVIGSRTPQMSDIPQLPYLEQIISESMRLYPPAWMIGRRALGDQPLGDYVLPDRALVLMSPYVVQRDARWFDDPDCFRPERWTPALKAALPPFAYFPFGGGARRCIGESFAWMELVLVAATLAQRWRIRAVSTQPPVPQPVMTLRMKNGLKAVVNSRSS
ncbi:MAG TPA: cytochrome P450, partial [Vicinamibacterales bacterium]|nr:cytochrome P450 [Vicinamibacterales bacterium]